MRMHISYGKTKKSNENVARERVILRLNITPLKNHCMSPCNFKKCELISPIASILTLLPTHPTSFSYFVALTAILGFFIRSLYLRLISVLLNFLFFLFSFLFSLYHNPRCNIVLSWMALSSLFCSLKVSFSSWMGLFKISNSKISFFRELVRDSSGLTGYSRLVEDPASIEVLFLSNDSMES